eukprot:scpid52420/ scgid24179/ Basic helix-loop-helix neural transcription factor TAP; Protein biparous; Target of Poxn protein
MSYTRHTVTVFHVQVAVQGLCSKIVMALLSLMINSSDAKRRTSLPSSTSASGTCSSHDEQSGARSESPDSGVDDANLLQEPSSTRRGETSHASARTERSTAQRSHPANTSDSVGPRVAASILQLKDKKKQTRVRAPAGMPEKQAKVWRRSRASGRELARIHALADALEDLRAIVPKSLDEEKATKVKLLRQASSYIQLLGEMLEAPPGPDACSTAAICSDTGDDAMSEPHSDPRHQFASTTSLMQLGGVSSLGSFDNVAAAMEEHHKQSEQHDDESPHDIEDDQRSESTTNSGGLLKEKQPRHLQPPSAPAAALQQHSSAVMNTESTSWESKKEALLDMRRKLEERQQLLSLATQPALQPPAVASAAFASAPPGGSVPVLQVAQSYHPNHLTLSAPTARTPPVDFLSSIQSPIIPVAPSPWSVSQASHPAGYEVQSRPITLSTGPPYTQLQQPSPHHPNIYHLASTTAASQPVHWSMATGTAANTPTQGLSLPAIQIPAGGAPASFQSPAHAIMTTPGLYPAAAHATGQPGTIHILPGFGIQANAQTGMLAWQMPSTGQRLY